MSTQNYIRLTEIVFLQRKHSALVFLNGVLVPDNWALVSAVAGDNGYVERVPTVEESHAMVAGEMEWATYIYEEGRVSIRIPAEPHPVLDSHSFYGEV